MTLEKKAPEINPLKNAWLLLLRTHFRVNEQYPLSVAAIQLLLTVSFLQQMSLCFSLYRHYHIPFSGASFVLTVFKVVRIQTSYETIVVILPYFLLIFNFFVIIANIITCVLEFTSYCKKSVIYRVSSWLTFHGTTIFFWVLTIPNTEMWLTRLIIDKNTDHAFEISYQRHHPPALIALGLISFLILTAIRMLTIPSQLYFKIPLGAPNKSTRNALDIVHMVGWILLAILRILADYRESTHWPIVVVNGASLSLYYWSYLRLSRFQQSSKRLYGALIAVMTLIFVWQIIEASGGISRDVFSDRTFILINLLVIPLIMRGLTSLKDMWVQYILIEGTKPQKKPNFHAAETFFHYMHISEANFSSSLTVLFAIGFAVEANIQNLVHSSTHHEATINYFKGRGIDIDTAHNVLATDLKELQGYMIFLYGNLIDRSLKSQNFPPLPLMCCFLNYLLYNADRKSRVLKEANRFLALTKIGSMNHALMTEVLSMIQEEIFNSMSEEEKNFQMVKYSAVIDFEESLYHIRSELEIIRKGYCQFYASLLENPADLNKVLKLGTSLNEKLRTTQKAFQQLFEDRNDHLELVRDYIRFLKRFRQAEPASYRILQLKCRELINKRLASKKDKADISELYDMNNHVVVIDLMEKVGNIIKCTKSFPAMFGYLADEILNHNITRVMPSYFGDPHDAWLINYGSQEGTSSFKVRKDLILYGLTKHNYLMLIKVYIKTEFFQNMACGVGVIQKVLAENTTAYALLDPSGFILHYTQNLEYELEIKEEHLLMNFYLWLFVPKLFTYFFPKIQQKNGGAMQNSDRSTLETFGIKKEEAAADDEEKEAQQTIENKKLYFFKHKQLESPEMKRFLRILSGRWRALFLKNLDSAAEISKQRLLDNFRTNFIQSMRDFDYKDADVYQIKASITDCYFYNRELHVKRLELTSFKKITKMDKINKILNLRSTRSVVTKVRAVTKLIGLGIQTNRNKFLTKIQDLAKARKKMGVPDTQVVGPDKVPSKIFSIGSLDGQLSPSHSKAKKSERKKSIASGIPSGVYDPKKTSNSEVEPEDDDDEEDEAEFEEGYNKQTTREVEEKKEEKKKEEVVVSPSVVLKRRVEKHSSTITSIPQEIGDYERFLLSARKAEEANRLGHFSLNTSREHSFANLLRSPRNEETDRFNLNNSNLSVEHTRIISIRGLMNHNRDDNDDSPVNSPISRNIRIPLPDGTRTTTIIMKGHEMAASLESNDGSNIIRVNGEEGILGKLHFEDFRKVLAFKEAAKIDYIQQRSPKNRAETKIDFTSAMKRHNKNASVRSIPPRDTRHSKEEGGSNRDSFGIPQSTTSERKRASLMENLAENKDPKLIRGLKYFGVGIFIFLLIFTIVFGVLSDYLFDQLEDLLTGIILPYFMNKQLNIGLRQSTLSILINRGLIPSLGSEADALRMNDMLSFSWENYNAFKGNYTLMEQQLGIQTVREYLDFNLDVNITFLDGKTEIGTMFNLFNIAQKALYNLLREFTSLSSNHKDYQMMQANYMTFAGLQFDIKSISDSGVDRVNESIKIFAWVIILVDIFILLATLIKLLLIQTRITQFRCKMLELICTFKKGAIKNEMQFFAQDLSDILMGAHKIEFKEDTGEITQGSQEMNRKFSSFKRLKFRMGYIILGGAAFFAVATVLSSVCLRFLLAYITSINDMFHLTTYAALLPRAAEGVTTCVGFLIVLGNPNSTLFKQLLYVQKQHLAFMPRSYQVYENVINFIQDNSQAWKLQPSMRKELKKVVSGSFCGYLYPNNTYRQDNCRTFAKGTEQRGIYSSTRYAVETLQSIMLTLETKGFEPEAIKAIAQDPSFYEIFQFAGYSIEGANFVGFELIKSILYLIDQVSRLTKVLLALGVTLYAIASLICWPIVIWKAKRDLAGTKEILKLIPRQLLKNNMYIKNFFKRYY